MKTLMTLALLVGFSSLSWARTTYETGRGQEFGTCSYNQGPFCISNIKNRAEAEAKRQAAWQCQLNGGSASTFSANCNTTCFPNMLSPNDKNRPVNCRSTCTLQCNTHD